MYREHNEPLPIVKRTIEIQEKIISLLKKFYKPFVITYIFFSVAISYYPSFDFYSFGGQILIISVATFNGFMGIYIKKL